MAESFVKFAIAFGWEEGSTDRRTMGRPLRWDNTERGDDRTTASLGRPTMEEKRTADNGLKEEIGKTIPPELGR